MYNMFYALSEKGQKKRHFFLLNIVDTCTWESIMGVLSCVAFLFYFYCDNDNDDDVVVVVVDDDDDDDVDGDILHTLYHWLFFLFVSLLTHYIYS